MPQSFLMNDYIADSTPTTLTETQIVELEVATATWPMTLEEGNAATLTNKTFSETFYVTPGNPMGSHEMV